MDEKVGLPPICHPQNEKRILNSKKAEHIELCQPFF